MKCTGPAWPNWWRWEPCRCRHPRPPSATESADQPAAEPAPASETITSEQIAALVGALLMQEQFQEEQARLHPAAEEHSEGSRWRMAGRMEVLRRFA